MIIEIKKVEEIWQIKIETTSFRTMLPTLETINIATVHSKNHFEIQYYWFYPISQYHKILTQQSVKVIIVLGRKDFVS